MQHIIFIYMQYKRWKGIGRRMKTATNNTQNWLQHFRNNCCWYYYCHYVCGLFLFLILFFFLNFVCQKYNKFWLPIKIWWQCNMQLCGRWCVCACIERPTNQTSADLLLRIETMWKVDVLDSIKPSKNALQTKICTLLLLLLSIYFSPNFPNE